MKSLRKMYSLLTESRRSPRSSGLGGGFFVSRFFRPVEGAGAGEGEDAGGTGMSVDEIEKNLFRLCVHNIQYEYSIMR